MDLLERMLGEQEAVKPQKMEKKFDEIYEIDTIEEVEKFNPYHDRLGRFTSAGSASSFTIRTRAGYNQGMADRAISREKQKQNSGGGKPMRNPTGDIEADRKAAWEGADYAFQFKNGSDRPQILDLHSDARTGANGEYAWAPEAYENLKLRAWSAGGRKPEYGAVYMIDKKSVQEAQKAADKAIVDRGIDNWDDAFAIYRKELVSRSLRSVDDKYVQDQHEMRKKNAGRARKSLYDTLVEVGKFNPYHDRLGRFSTAGSAASFTIRTKDPGKQHWADRAIAREKDGWEASKPKEIEFTPAKNKKEAVKYAQEKLGFSKVSYGTKMDIDTINHINKTITSVQAKYPEVKGAVQELKTTSSRGVYAQVRTKSDGSMNLEMGTKLYGAGLDSLKKSYDHCIEVGYHPKGTEYDSIIWHEYGHVLASISTKSNYGLSSREQFAADDSKNRLGFAYSRRANKVEQGWLREASDSLKENTVSVSLSISKYAAKNAAEAFAEAFAEVTCSKNPREEALAVVKASGWYRE